MPTFPEGITPLLDTSCNLFGDVVDIERQYCSNFTCCNQTFANLHSLMDHHDGHGFRHANDSFTSPSSSLASTSTMSSPVSPVSPMMPSTPIDSFIQWHMTDEGALSLKRNPSLPSPQIEAPQPRNWPLLNAGYGLLEDLEIGEVPIYEQCFKTAVSSTSTPHPSESALFSSSSRQYQHRSPPQSMPPPSRESSPGIEPRRARSQELQSSPKVKKSKSTLSLKEDILHKKPSKKSEGRGHGGRRRERRYICPTPGCTKQYLNPNGLKYHQEKGTCSFASPSSESEADIPNSTVTSSPSRHSSPPPSPVSPAETTPITLPTITPPVLPSIPRIEETSSRPTPFALPPPLATPMYRYPTSQPYPTSTFSSSSLSNWNGCLSA